MYLVTSLHTLSQLVFQLRTFHAASLLAPRYILTTMEKYDSIELKSSGSDLPRVHATHDLHYSDKKLSSEVLEDVPEKSISDARQHDRRDMERMGKTQELRV